MNSRRVAKVVLQMHILYQGLLRAGGDNPAVIKHADVVSESRCCCSVSHEHHGLAVDTREEIRENFCFGRNIQT